jgi:RNA polymerase sigma factor (sigma-70 family)
VNPIPEHPRDGTENDPQAAQRFRPMLLRYFRRHLQHEADAEDLVQEALMRLVRSPTQVEHAEAYVLRIASNLLRDRFRRDRSHHAGLHEPLDDTLYELPSEEPGTDDVYASRERLERLLSALDELSPRCRQVFLLQRYEGMTYTAIARQLQVSVSAVEKHMMHALLHLQTRLAEP